MSVKRICLAGLLVASSSTMLQAKPIWQDFSLSALYGENYKLTNEKEQTTITAEYAAKFKYGDVFGFYDRAESGGDKTNYFELSPRLSLGAVSGKNLSYGIVKDVLISTTWEGSDSSNNYLYGLGFDLNLPKFQYANINFYRVNNENQSDDWQMTLSYALPFNIRSEEFLFDGFLDWSTAEQDSKGVRYSSELNWTSQLKWNVGKHISADTRLYLGVEYSHWTNKYGVAGVDENNVSALLKYHF